MKKIIIFLTVLFCSLTVMVACNNKKKDVRVYSFSGENEIMAVYDGVIVITPNEVIFSGGNLKLKEEYKKDIKEYNKAFYFGDREQSILSTDYTTQGDVEEDFSEDDSITKWSASLNSTWTDYILTAMDIDSDSYVLMVLKKEEFEKAKELAKAAFHRIAPAQDM